jgi:hypothetical protein
MSLKTIHEPARDIPVIDETDVLVVGAGPAGIGAALAAGRSGVKTLLVEQFNCVGGMATSGLMSHFTGSASSPFYRELVDAMEAHPPGQAPYTHTATWHGIRHEALKSVLLRKLDEAHVGLRLYTFACDAIMEGTRIRGIVCESKSGRGAILAKVVIDGTGDGDVAARAGAAFQLGREEDHVCQPVTLMFRIGGVDYERAVFPPSFESFIQLPKGEIQALGKANLPFPAGHVLLYRTSIPNEVCVNMTNVIEIDGTKAEDLTRAERTCRRQMDAIVLFLREVVPGYENCYLVASAQNIGVRETRHFRGEYTLTAEDIVEARVFDDWIAARNAFNFDIHNTKGHGLDANGAQREFRAKGEYTIPYRACVPETIDGLLLAGRNISGTHKAHSNFRVMSICLNMGHGVGTAAAIAVQDGVRPRDVDVAKVQARLMAAGVTLK